MSSQRLSAIPALASACRATPLVSQNVTPVYAPQKPHENKGLTNAINGDVTSEPRLARLSPLQIQALDLLQQGHSVNATAARLGVTRVTISRWKNHHPAFVAELNQRQQDLLSESALRYRRLLHRSLKLVNRKLQDDDPQALRAALGIINGPASRKALAQEPGPTDPVGVVNQQLLQDYRTWNPAAEYYIDGNIHRDFVRQHLAPQSFDPEPLPAQLTPAQSPASPGATS